MSLISTKRKAQTGVGMIEVLIAVLVFALGVLGMASMQISAKRTSYDALQRSLATSLARDIIERMRSNPSDAALAIYSAASNLGGGSISSEPSPACDSSASACTHSQLARHDLWEWEQALDGATESLDGDKVGGLVSPKACISNAANVITVTIVWKGYAGLVDADSSVSCGQGLGLYGADEKDRQLVQITSYVEEV